ncbi:hypothetical protein [Proteiniclasticum ruminis]|uniref:Uncharacterized protein n=1 Tax=Proteiniclasticum ruminis TaxID=398199 RepID=A0A1G8KLD2_9CLOT|nr:hypothetical protein [Proteiniclasticum ruminis]SDI44199.1 hypothetical protein SAMN05421804_102357 [Proteiniclasticum ruminis]
MADKIKHTRREEVVNSILDAGALDIKNIGVDATHVIIHEVKEWLIDRYNKVKSNPINDQKMTLDDLEMRIKISNKNVDIGMRKKEIAIMWAMKRLGYGEEQTQEVLDLANIAYQKRE